MKIELIIPPVACPTIVYPSVPCLTAYLRQRGFEVVQRDFNAKAFDYFLSASCIETCLKKLSTRKSPDLQCQNENQKGLTSEKLLMIGEYVLSTIEEMKSQFRKYSGFSDFEKYRKNRRILDAALEIISSAYAPSKLSIYGFEMRYDLHSVEDVLESIYNRDENMFIQYFEESALPLIAQDKPSIVGISIGYLSQLIPGLSLARIIKQELPEIHLTLGGWHITTVGQELIRHAEKFKAFDSLVLHEGEVALEELAHRLEKGISIHGTANVAFSDKSRTYLPDTINHPKKYRYPFPDFEGLELDLLLAPEPIFSIPITRGCYWKKCTFCCEHSYGAKYKPVNVDTLINGIIRMQQRYPEPMFYFASPAFPPSLADSFCSAVLEKKIKIAWTSLFRLEKSFSLELFKKMSKAGCKIAIFGLESGSQRLVDLMDKRFDVKYSEKLIEASSKAGIWNHMTLIIGFPTETRAEAEQTQAYLIRNKKHWNSAAAHLFVMEKGSRLVMEREKFPFVEVEENSAGLSALMRFRVKSGMTPLEKQELQRQFYEKVISPQQEKVTNCLLGHDLVFIVQNGINFFSPCH